MELDTIYNEDCLIGMQRIPDGSIDAIICDLPYGTTDCSWDSIIPLDNLWCHYERILTEKGTVVLFAQQPFSSILVSSNIKLFRHSLTWIKDKCSNFIASRYQPPKFTEDILVFSNGNFVHNAKIRATYNPQMVNVGFAREVEKETPTKMSDGFSLTQVRDRPVNKKTLLFGYKKDPYTQFPKNYVYYTVPHKKSERFHPTQKPVELIRYLVRTYTNEGDVILDNCIGSGTTAIACIKEKRHFIGFELDKGYYDIAQQRINNERQQQTIF